MEQPTSGYRCYHCGSGNAAKDGFYKGKQKLKCRDCGRRFFESLEPERVSCGVRCYHCEGMETCKAGFSRFNGREKQRYFCRTCRRYFREDLELPRVDPGTRNFWVKKNLPSAGHLVLELRALAQHLGRTPTVYDISDRSKQGLGNPRNTYRAVFGGFSEALKRAKLVPDHLRQYSPEKMIAELRELRKKLGRPLRMSDIKEAYQNKKAPSFYFLKRAFGSVTKALSAADAGHKVYTRDEMIACLRRFDSTLDRRITQADIIALYRQGKGPSYDAVKGMFGSIQNAIRAAGIKRT